MGRWAMQMRPLLQTGRSWSPAWVADRSHYGNCPKETCSGAGETIRLPLSADGQRLAYSDLDENGQNLVQIRSGNGAELLHSLPGHQSLIWKMFFSTDGSWLISTDDQEIRLWDAQDGTLLRRLGTVCE